MTGPWILYTQVTVFANHTCSVLHISIPVHEKATPFFAFPGASETSPTLIKIRREEAEALRHEAKGRTTCFHSAAESEANAECEDTTPSGFKALQLISLCFRQATRMPRPPALYLTADTIYMRTRELLDSQRLHATTGPRPNAAVLLVMPIARQIAQTDIQEVARKLTSDI